MPYISEYRRSDLEDLPNPASAGELNFVFTSLIINYLGPNPSYSTYNEVVGALECCKLELVRRSLSNYEDSKALQNGDMDYPHRSNVE